MKIEHKRFKGEIKQLDGEGSFEAVIATLAVVDADGDIIMPGAFQNARLSVLPAHDSRHIPLGKAKPPAFSSPPPGIAHRRISLLVGSTRMIWFMLLAVQ